MHSFSRETAASRHLSFRSDRDACLLCSCRWKSCIEWQIRPARNVRNTNRMFFSVSNVAQFLQAPLGHHKFFVRCDVEIYKEASVVVVELSLVSTIGLLSLSFPLTKTWCFFYIIALSANEKPDLRGYSVRPLSRISRTGFLCEKSRGIPQKQCIFN